MIDDEAELIETGKILSNARTIAIVGLSDNPSKPSYDVANFLADKGYKVVGVNPAITKSGNIDVYPDLASVPFEIDIINVFRRSENIPEIIPQVLLKNPKSLWLQQGIRNDVAVEPVIKKGLFVMQDKCIAVYYNLCKPYFANTVQ